MTNYLIATKMYCPKCGCYSVHAIANNQAKTLNYRCTICEFSDKEQFTKTEYSKWTGYKDDPHECKQDA